jgi:hypothetical protein
MDGKPVKTINKVTVYEGETSKGQPAGWARGIGQV